MIRPLSLSIFCAFCSLLPTVLNGVNHGPVSSAKSLSEVLKQARPEIPLLLRMAGMKTGPLS